MLTCRRPAALLALLSALPLSAPAARAQGELKRPYQLKVVLHVAKHRLLTEIFRQRLERELRDGLQGALGELGQVEVVRDHPLLPRVLAEGLQAALDGWQERSEFKTHFVLVNYSGVHYEIQARQHDGTTGLPSPVVRYDRTRDRAFVAKTAALLVKQDFGLLGTVLGEPDAGGAVKVGLRGGGLDVPWERWVRPGDVFALLQGGAGAARPVPWAVVQVKDEPKDGTCACRLYHRYELRQAAGLRCVKLGTVRAPLRLRFVRELPGKTVAMDTPLKVEVRHLGFSGEGAGKCSGTTDTNGVIDTARDGAKGLFDGLAFVSVLVGGDTKAQVPVALVADRQVVVEIALGGNDAGTVLALKALAWQRAVADAYLVQTDLFKEINGLTAKPDKRAEALAEVRKALDRSRQDRDRLGREHGPLVGELNKLPARERPDLAVSERLLAQLEAGEAQLRTHVARLEQIEREENDPKTKDWLARVNQGQLLEKEFEVGKAIDVYEKVLAEGFDNAQLRTHLADLKKKWEPKDDKHREARQFIYQVWPTLDTAGLKANLDKAQEALSVCRHHKDVIAAQRLFKASEAHAVRLAKEAEGLRPDINIQDEVPAKLIKEVEPGLKKLAADILEFLNRERGAG